VNRLLFETTTAERYATVFYGVYDRVTGTLSYANAGHYPPLLVRGKLVMRLDSLTAPVGMFADLPPADSQVRLRSGDWLVVVSDGIPEACDHNGREFGDERLLALLKRSVAADSFCKNALDAVALFGGKTQADDLTLLAVRVLPGAHGNHTEF
jgi:sigma-B regulation protein RsbU (phosphoserine phosphatase)